VFIELTEILKCPHDHETSYVICGPVTMDGRDVVRGGLVCPVCKAEFPILDRVAWFAPPGNDGRTASPPRTSPLTAEAAVAFLGLEGPGGYALTVGDAGRLGPELGVALPRIGVVGVNPPDDVVPSATFSVLRSARGFPIRPRSVRAVVIGAGGAANPWLAAGIDALLPGLRVVVEGDAPLPGGIVELARGAGVVVGEKRAR